MRSSTAEVLTRLTRRFSQQFGDLDDVTVFMAPGRVNLIGEYTDFNDGFVLPMTVDRGVYIAIRRRADRRIGLYANLFNERVDIRLDELGTSAPGSWQSYVLGVTEVLRDRGTLAGGFEAVIDGDLQHGAGLSSSAALETSVTLALQGVFGFSMTPVERVKLCHHVEHTYAQVQCGVMDQFACGIGQRGHALLLDCRSLDHTLVPADFGDYRLLIINSEVRRTLATSAYNARREECQAGVATLQMFDPGIVALRDVTPELFAAHAESLDPVVRKRVGHVVSENQRVLEAADSLRAGALADFGTLMLASHESLSRDFEVSCPELDALVALASGEDGVLGARMTGAGFGGCTVNLVHRDAVTDVMTRIHREYEGNFGFPPTHFVLEDNGEAGVVE